MDAYVAYITKETKSVTTVNGDAEKKVSTVNSTKMELFTQY